VGQFPAIPLLYSDSGCRLSGGHGSRGLPAGAPAPFFADPELAAAWVLIFILYPLFSVYPQELLYRTFFFHRYRPLFGGGWGMVIASALAFGFVHIIFRN